ncbi:MAG: hypothetical protein L6405_01205 [Actinomycetia bacterium]|nr:hypothetical protein [Actinomycetes bacterium]
MRNNKTYIMIAILTVIFLFTIAATCNQCGTPIEIKIGTEEVEEPEEVEESKEDDLKETTTASEEEEDEQIAELPKEKLSSDQTRVISLFGHPDQFTIIFDEGSNNKRIDMWIYFDMEALFIFENGTYDNSEQYYGGKSQEPEYEVLPQDFIYGMTPIEVETLIGEKGTESFEENTGLNVLTFGEGEIICIFNPDSSLILASRQNKLSNET